MTQTPRFAARSLLIATPNLVDPNFRRSVVLVWEHDENGAFGVVVNRPMQLPLPKVFPSIFEGQDEEPFGAANYGGPVDPNRMLAIRHLQGSKPGLLGDESVTIVPGIELIADVDKALQGIANREFDAHRFRFFLGYAGWGAGQLDQELDEGSWIVGPASDELVFLDPPDDIWARTLKDLGGIYRLFAELPPDPECN